ncbi:putative membrane protein YesL [Arthrobacter bambusae]|uniref:Membrane protein YesL n=1 Tax=Arthrobacter bambusae TaxID=1338426 RepID=A0ABV2P9I5_9MICC
MAAKEAQYGSGPLFKAAGVVYGVMVGGALLVLANALVVLMPLLAGLVGPAALLGFALVGPSVVASCYAFNRLLTGEDTGVFHDFLRSYRRNFSQAAVVWLPYAALLAVIVANLSSLPGSNPETVAARIGLVGLGLLVSTAALHAMLLLARFNFRTMDIYRLSIYSIGARKRVALGNVGILFIAGFVLISTSVWLMLFVGGLMVYLLCLNSRPLLAMVEERFTVAVAAGADVSAAGSSPVG